jgi:hypothetical protein
MADEHTIARYRNLYAKLLRFYPKPYRERFQEPMEQTFNDICRERAAAGRGLLGLAVWLCAETAESIMREHIEVVTMRNKGIVRAALVTASVLLIPLWGNTYIDGWHWHWYTFVLAAAFLFSGGLTYELIARTKSNRAYRFAVGLAVATAFALIWANRVLAAYENPANLLYVGVVVIGVIGAAISRLRARGMARALFGTAVAQVLAPIIALVFWKTNLALGKAVPVIGVNGLFAMLFVASAILFRHAARKHT